MPVIKSIIKFIPKGWKKRTILLISLLVLLVMALVLALSLWKAVPGDGNLKNAPVSPANNLPPAPKPIQLQIMQPDSVQDDLLGKVRSVETTSYKDDAGTKGASNGRTLDTYNQQGCILKRSSWDGNGNLKESVVSIYDAQGNFFTRKTLGAHGEVLSLYSLRFDPTAKQITNEIKKDDGSLEKIIVSIYDNFGKEHEIKHFDSLGNQTGRTVIERDGKGKEVAIAFYGRYNELQKTIGINWNPDGSPAEEMFSEDVHGVTTDINFEYPRHDSQGNWLTQIEKEVFEKEGQTTDETDSILERVITYY